VSLGRSQESFSRSLTVIRYQAEGRSSLIIAHRLSTLYNTDKIIVLGGSSQSCLYTEQSLTSPYADGQVLEVGTHKELLNKPDGVFAGMWQAQIQSEIEVEEKGEDK
jgi:ABC-type bacteriocin/lantibiotic exporter with double-glycine peptidase domain